jgi:hypoxanthine phosphoribosyltransferase
MKQIISFPKCKTLVNKINNYLQEIGVEDYSLYGIPRGGIIPATLLAFKTGLNLDFTFDKKKHLIIVDDICDSGNTFIKIMEHRHNVKYKTITVSLFWKPTSKFIPDFYAEKTSNWIVFPWEDVETSKYDGTKIL